MFLKDILTVIFYLISITVGTLGIFTFYKPYRKRLKITNDKPSFWLFDTNQFTTMWPFTVANKGPRRIVINDAYFRFNDAKDTPYRVRADFDSPSNRDSEANFRLALNDGEKVTCRLDYMDFDYLIDKIKADKVQLVIIDTVGMHYNSPWFKIKRYPFNSGSIDQMRLNDSFVLGNGKPKNVKRKLNPHQLQLLN